MGLTRKCPEPGRPSRQALWEAEIWSLAGAAVRAMNVEQHRVPGWRRLLPNEITHEKDLEEAIVLSLSGALRVDDFLHSHADAEIEADENPEAFDPFRGGPRNAR